MHANRLKPYYDPADHPIEPPNDDLVTPDLQESDLPSDSFVSEVLQDVPRTLSEGISVPATLNVDNADDSEPPITCPEDRFEPAIICAV